MKQVVISFLSTSTLIGDALLVLLVLLLLFTLTRKKQSKFASLISENAIPLCLFIATFATVGSLTLSEILGFTPCKLCWFQRIFMYPQVIILGIVAIINDTKAKIYSLVLSLIGFIIAIYHILVQFFPGVFQCSDEVAKCSARQTMQYGYITIPVMSATAFALIIIILLYSYLSKGKK